MTRGVVQTPPKKDDIILTAHYREICLLLKKYNFVTVDFNPLTGDYNYMIWDYYHVTGDFNHVLGDNTNVSAIVNDPLNKSTKLTIDL